MRFYFTANPDTDFDEILLYIQIIINNSPNFVTGLISNEIYYNFKIKNFINLLFIEDLFMKFFDKLRLVLKKKKKYYNFRLNYYEDSLRFEIFIVTF